MQGETRSATLIYVAYASADKKFWAALSAHLSPLQESHLIKTIDARAVSQKEAASALKQAQIILLLLSPAFFQTTRCTWEMHYALEKHRAQEVRIIPVRLRPIAGWDSLPISELEVIPPHNQSIQTARHRDRIFAAIGDEICQVLETFTVSPSAAHISERPALGLPLPIDSSLIVPRREVVEKLYAMLIHPASSGVLMTGLIGIGKTQLAELLYHHVEQLRIAGNSLFAAPTIWLHMRTTTTLTEIVDELCHHLHKALFDTWNLPPPLLAEELFHLLNTLEQPRLIIFDQFETLLSARTGQARNPQDGITELLQLLAHRPCTCRLLLVSRFSPWNMPAYAPLPLQSFEVPPLEREESVALLRLWGVQGWHSELEDAVTSCQGHAQALVCLQAVLKLDNNTSLSALSHKATYKQLWISNTAYTFIEHCYRHQLNSEQRLLLRSFSLYRQPVPQKAVLEMLCLEDETRGLPAALERLAALKVLLSLKLLSSAGTGCYAAAPVVAESIRICFQQDNVQAFQQAHACAARYYRQLAHNKQRYGKDQRQQRGDIQELLEASWHLCQAQFYEEAYQLLQEEHLYTSLRRWGESTTLEEIYQQFLQWHAGPTLAIYNALGEIATMQGQAYEALEYFMHALSLCQDAASSEEEVRLLSNLGSVYRKLGQLEAAHSQYQQALSICEMAAISPEAHGVVLNNLGMLLYERGRARQESEQPDDGKEYDLAIIYYKHALLLYQQASIPDEATRTLNNLGQIYSICQRKVEARNTYQQALSLAHQIEARWAEAVALGSLGTLYCEQADLKQAQTCYVQALRLFRQTGSSWEEAALLRELGTLLLLNQYYDVALAAFIRARDIFRALQCPERAEIPDWAAAELRLALRESTYEDCLQNIERDPIALLEQLMNTSDPTNSKPQRSVDAESAYFQ